MERIWIYQSNRELNAKDQNAVLDKLEAFTMQWEAHGKPLAASVEIRYNRFVIIAVDEKQAMPTGCSIDKSVKLLQEIEIELDINLFDRLLIAYRAGSDISVSPKADFEKLVENGTVNGDTIVFNNLAANREELNNKWEVPFKDSWHAKVFS